MLQHYNNGFNPNEANYVPLSPLSFIKRAATIYPDHTALIYGDRQYNWLETYNRSQKLAGALVANGIKKGDTVSIIAANTPELFEAHYGVPMSGAVLNTINFRLEVETIAYILEFGDCQALLTDTQFAPVVRKALERVKANTGRDILVIDIIDESLPRRDDNRLGKMDYESFLATAAADYQWQMPTSEWDAIALNFTSGTSGKPKGVIYHHRGSYLMSMGTIAAWQLAMHPKYLYIVPMFHCNGWGHVWTMAVVAGTTVCCREISAENMFNLMEQHEITHFGGAPIVLGLLANAEEGVKKQFDKTIQVMTAGAPPPASILEKTAQLGFNVTHVYGLTETYGHVIYCAFKTKWQDLAIAEQAEIKSRQGVCFPMTEAVDVLDVDSRVPVAWDGESMGEIVIRGNTTMKGYYKDSAATEAAFKNGWFNTGDIAVIYADGYIQLKDRLKDIIISGGENISSVEVESALYKHPAVAAAAVVAKPDEKWGETPCAFIELKTDQQADEAEMIKFCRDHLAGFKCPKTVVFKELPKTATGKIQKFILRQQAHSM